MKKIYLLVLIITSMSLFSEAKAQNFNRKVTSYRIGEGGFWFALETKPNDIVNGYYRMHAFIPKTCVDYKELVSALLLAYNTEKPIKYLWYYTDYIETKDVIRVYMLEM